jgi:di/tricarboxylate transporter
VRTPRVISPDLSRHARTLIAQYGPGPGSAAQALAFDRETGLAEVVIPPRSPFVGERVFPGMATEAGDLVVQAVQRKGEPVGERGV